MTRIVIELSDQHKHLALALQAMAEQVERLGSGGADGKSIDYAKIEREVGAASAAVERAAHQGERSSDRAGIGGLRPLA